MILKDEIDCAFTTLTHYDLIPHVANKISAQSYLEIGCASDDCFRLIEAKHKIGVDPVRGGTHKMTSDQFFAENKETFDVIFVDGMHKYEQVIKDINNALQILNPNGIIFMHDVLPAHRYNAVPDKKQKPRGVVAWNGDVWRASFEIASRNDLRFNVFTCRHGVGIIQNLPTHNPLSLNNTSWEDYLNNWNKLSKLSTLEDVDKILSIRE